MSVVRTYVSQLPLFDINVSSSLPARNAFVYLASGVGWPWPPSYFSFVISTKTLTNNDYTPVQERCIKMSTSSSALIEVRILRQGCTLSLTPTS